MSSKDVDTSLMHVALTHGLLLLLHSNNYCIYPVFG